MKLDKLNYLNLLIDKLPYSTSQEYVELHLDYHMHLDVG